MKKVVKRGMAPEVVLPNFSSVECEDMPLDTPFTKYIGMCRYEEYDDVFKASEEGPPIALMPLYDDFLFYDIGLYKPTPQLSVPLKNDKGGQLFTAVSVMGAIVNFANREDDYFIVRLNWGSDYGILGEAIVHRSMLPVQLWMTFETGNVRTIFENFKEK